MWGLRPHEWLDYAHTLSVAKKIDEAVVSQFEGLSLHVFGEDERVSQRGVAGPSVISSFGPAHR